jgi:hypothetical protein
MLGPNNNAVAFLLPLCICLQRSATAPRASTRRVHALLAFLMFLGIVMTGSRGGMLAAVLCTLVLLAVAPRGGGSGRYLIAGVTAGWWPSSCIRSVSPSAGDDYIVVGPHQHLESGPRGLSAVLPVGLRMGDLPHRLRPHSADRAGADVLAGKGGRTSRTM